jgi:hypothetical protein
MRVYPYHTDKDPEDPVHHIYDDCPAGEHLIRDGNRIGGDGGFRLCKLCKSKQDTGHF